MGAGTSQSELKGAQMIKEAKERLRLWKVFTEDFLDKHGKKDMELRDKLIENVKECLKNKGNVDWVHLIYIFNIKADEKDKGKSNVQGEIRKLICSCLKQALSDLNDRDDHAAWGWFKQFILDSDVKYFHTESGLPLFWDFAAIAKDYEKKFQEKFKEKMNFLIQQTKSFAANTRNKELLKALDIKDGFEVRLDPDINQKTLVNKMVSNGLATKLIDLKISEQLREVMNSPVGPDQDRKLLHTYLNDFTLVQSLDQMKFAIKGEQTTDPFQNVFEMLKEDDRLLVEQTSLTKFLKNGQTCNKEFQDLAENAFKQYNDLMIHVPIDEMKEQNKLQNSFETQDEALQTFKVKNSNNPNYLSMLSEFQEKEKIKYLTPITPFKNMYKILKGPPKDFERAWQKVCLDQTGEKYPRCKHLKDVIRMSFTFKIPFAMFIGFKIFKKVFMHQQGMGESEREQAQIWCMKNMHAWKDIHPNEDPGYMDFKFNVHFNNGNFSNSSITEVQMMLQTILDCKDYLHTVYEITRNVGMWGAIAGGCVTKVRGITSYKLYELPIDIKEVNDQKKSSNSNYSFLLESTQGKPRVDVSLMKDKLVMQENCTRSGKEAILFKATDPLKIKVINKVSGKTESEYILDDFGQVFQEQCLTNKFFLKYKEECFEEVHLKRTINSFQNIKGKSLIGLYVQSSTPKFRSRLVAHWMKRLSDNVLSAIDKNENNNDNNDNNDNNNVISNEALTKEIKTHNTKEFLIDKIKTNLDKNAILNKIKMKFNTNIKKRKDSNSELSVDASAKVNMGDDHTENVSSNSFMANINMNLKDHESSDNSVITAKPTIAPEPKVDTSPDNKLKTAQLMTTDRKTNKTTDRKRKDFMTKDEVKFQDTNEIKKFGSELESDLKKVQDTWVNEITNQDQLIYNILSRDCRTMNLQVLIWKKGSSEPQFEQINLEEPELNSDKIDKLKLRMQKIKYEFYESEQLNILKTQEKTQFETKRLVTLPEELRKQVRKNRQKKLDKEGEEEFNTDFFDTHRDEFINDMNLLATYHRFRLNFFETDCCVEVEPKTQNRLQVLSYKNVQENPIFMKINRAISNLNTIFSNSYDVKIKENIAEPAKDESYGDSKSNLKSYFTNKSESKIQGEIETILLEQFEQQNEKDNLAKWVKDFPVKMGGKSLNDPQLSNQSNYIKLQEKPSDLQWWLLNEINTNKITQVERLKILDLLADQKAIDLFAPDYYKNTSNKTNDLFSQTFGMNRPKRNSNVKNHTANLAYERNQFLEKLKEMQKEFYESNSEYSINYDLGCQTGVKPDNQIKHDRNQDQSYNSDISQVNNHDDKLNLHSNEGGKKVWINKKDQIIMKALLDYFYWPHVVQNDKYGKEIHENDPEKLKQKVSVDYQCKTNFNQRQNLVFLQQYWDYTKELEYIITLNGYDIFNENFMNKLDRFQNPDGKDHKSLNNKFNTYVLDFAYKFFYEFSFVAKHSIILETHTWMSLLNSQKSKEILVYQNSWGENIICVQITHDSIWVKSLVWDGLLRLEVSKSMRIPLRSHSIFNQKLEYINRHFCARPYDPFLILGQDSKLYVLHSVKLEIVQDFDLELENLYSIILQFEISPDQRVLTIISKQQMKETDQNNPNQRKICQKFALSAYDLEGHIETEVNQQLSSKDPDIKPRNIKLNKLEQHKRNNYKIFQEKNLKF